MAKQSTNLVYFFSETHYFAKDFSILNVTLVGPLSQKNIVTFENCAQEIVKSASKCIILNFRDVPPEMDSNFIPMFEKIVKQIRARPAHIRISGLHPALRSLFLEQLLIQADEMTNNLADALGSIPSFENNLKKAG